MNIDLDQYELSNLHWLLALAKSGSACKNYDLSSEFVMLNTGDWNETVRQKVLAVLDKTKLPNKAYPVWVNIADLPLIKMTGFPLYGQRDSRWAGKHLGTSNTTIGDYGCLVTCLGMLSKLTPDLMNDEMVKSNMFYGGNLVASFDISKIAPNIKYLNTQGRYYAEVPASVMADLKEHLKTNPAILEVDINKNVQGLQQHFVLAIEVQNDKIVILDPWTNAKTLLSPLYGTNDSLAIYRIIKYQNA